MGGVASDPTGRLRAATQRRARPQHRLGNEGKPRRYVDYLPTGGFTTLNALSSIGAVVPGASTVPLLWNVFRSYGGRVVTVDDPWGFGSIR